MVQIQSLLGTLAALASLATSSPIIDNASIAPRGFSPYFDHEARSLVPRSSCPLNTATSCRNTTAQSNLCCFESPGGLLVFTQFWDVDPAVGPADSWTIHGLWPDPCDGDFKNFKCSDPDRFYLSPKALLEAAHRQDLIDYMNVYWMNNSGGTEEFWKHEWDKHGSCYSTLNPSCLPPGSPRGTEAVLYFDRVVQLFKSLTTYKYLAKANILPGSTTFSLAKMQDAIRSSPFGKTVGIDCSQGNLQVYYWFNLKGSVLDGELIPIDAPKPGSCPKNDIRYLPKSGNRPTGNPGGGNGGSGGTPPPQTGNVPTKANIRPFLNGNVNGGLISGGTWSAQAPATYTIASSGSGFTLRTSKGPCGVSGTSFSCGSAMSASVFSATPGNGGRLLLGVGNETKWSAGAVPGGNNPETINLGSSGTVDFTLAIVAVA